MDIVKATAKVIKTHSDEIEHILGYIDNLRSNTIIELLEDDPEAFKNALDREDYDGICHRIDRSLLDHVHSLLGQVEHGLNNKEH